MLAPIVGRGCGFLLKEGRRRRSDGKAWFGRRAAASQRRTGDGPRQRKDGDTVFGCGWRVNEMLGRGAASRGAIARRTTGR